MRGKACLLAVILLLFMIPSVSAESGKELVENSRHFDYENYKNTVTFQGEVIGVMMRGDNAWVNVYDNGVAIGIWCSAEDAKNISLTGDYTHVGDTVEVSGIFHMACPEHGGDLDIHAENFTILARGRVVERVPGLLAVVVSVALMALAIFTIFWLRRRRKEVGKIVPWPMPWG